MNRWFLFHSTVGGSFPERSAVSILAVLVFFSLSLILSPRQPLAQAARPIIDFETKRLDIGLVKPGETAMGVFIVRNRGDADLHIKRVAPT